MNDTLQQAITAIKMGDKQSAQALLAQIIANDPRNELAWLWLGECVDEVDRKLRCYRRVLAINPHNTQARQCIAQLTMQAARADTATPATPNVRDAGTQQKGRSLIEPTKSCITVAILLGIALAMTCGVAVVGLYVYGDALVGWFDTIRGVEEAAATPVPTSTSMPTRTATPLPSHTRTRQPTPTYTRVVIVPPSPTPTVVRSPVPVSVSSESSTSVTLIRNYLKTIAPIANGVHSMFPGNRDSHDEDYYVDALKSFLSQLDQMDVPQMAEKTHSALKLATNACALYHISLSLAEMTMGTSEFDDYLRESRYWGDTYLSLYFSMYLPARNSLLRYAHMSAQDAGFSD